MLRALLLIPVALLLTNCAVTIHDRQFCALIPGHHGAVCDNFLSANQLVLTEAEWTALQMEWLSKGEATQCTTSSAIGDIKREIGKLCSVTACTYEMKEKVNAIITGLDRVEALTLKTLP